jgi:stage IV sporulation protein FB
MSRVKIKIKPLFILYVFLCIYFGWFNKIFYYVIAVVLHEYGHYVVGKIKGYEFESVVFSVYGGGLYGSNSFKRKDDIIISLAGPLVNIFLILIAIALWWFFPTMYYFTYDFVVCNFVVFVFNILPFYPLDGGRIIVSLLQSRFNKVKILKILKVISIVISLFFLILFIFSIFGQYNINLLFVSLYLTINTILNDNYIYNDKIKCLIKNTEKPIEVKTFLVSKCDNKYNLIKYTSPNYYSVFEIKNGNNSVRLTEEDLYDL